MELLLNLVWVTMALAAFCVFMRKRSADSQLPNVPYGTAMLVLACVLVLLFPFVSASDDLHPSQAVLEDATKRMQQAVAPYQHVQTTQFTPMLPSMMAVYMLFALVALQLWRPVSCQARVISRERNPHDGRSPPSL